MKKVTMADVEGDEEDFAWMNMTDTEKRESLHAMLEEIDTRIQGVEYFLDEYLLGPLENMRALADHGANSEVSAAILAVGNAKDWLKTGAPFNEAYKHKLNKAK